MGSRLLSIYDDYEVATNVPAYFVEQYNYEKSFSMVSMICGDDSSCDTDGDNHGCGCNT